MKAKTQFEKANEIIRLVKRSEEGNLVLWDVLDNLRISIYWWKSHKSWFFYRHQYMELMDIDGLEYLVYKNEMEGKPNDPQKTL